MTIYISPSVNGIIKDSFDTNIELSGWFLAEKINNGDLLVGNTSLALGQEMNVSPLQILSPKTIKSWCKKRQTTGGSQWTFACTSLWRYY